MKRLRIAAATLPRAFWWSLAFYTCITAWQGREVLQHLFTGIASDTGDPLLNATVLSWGAQNVPLTQRWWNLPIFAPTPNALTFAEHLLGVSPVATPLYWLTGSGLAAYNLTILLTFVLSATAMYALVYHLTRSAAASFLAGLAYGFAPYRIAHLWHLQVVASFWAPLALLGLHRYLATGRVSSLALFGAAWALQAASNGYYLVFFSVVVALWIVWFVLLARRWNALWRIAVAGVVAAVPLAPIVIRYLAVHRSYGFSRSFAEVVYFSPDLAGVLCASARLQFWSWLQIGCRLEGELFPGVTAPLVCIVVALGLSRSAVQLPRMRSIRAVVWVALAVALVYIAIALSVAWGGAWRIEFGPITATASTFKKPFSNALWALAVGFVLTARFGRIGGSSASWFYACAVLATWMLALGPMPMQSGTRVLDTAPYAWLMALPGVESLRVPARFWMMTVLCLSILMGILLADLLARTSRRVAAVAAFVIAGGLLVDGWIAAIPVDSAPTMLWADRLADSTVLELPFLHVDTAPGVRAVEGGWRTVNGYSGYEPPAYSVLRAAGRAEDGSFLRYLTSDTHLKVVVEKAATRQVEMVERELGARPVAESGGWLFYLVPQRTPVTRVGTRIPIVSARASCALDLVHQAIDSAPQTFWDCGHQFRDEELTLDLGQVHAVAALRYQVGRRPSDHPRDLVVETSEDGAEWRRAWSGGTAGLVFRAAVADWRNVTIVLPFESRTARYIRLRQIGRDPETHWAVAELEVYGS